MKAGQVRLRLEDAGCVFVRYADHGRLYRCPGGRYTLIPDRDSRELSAGEVATISRQSGVRLRK